MAGGAAGPVRIRVLGGLAVDGRTETELGSRKARTLLKALALARGGWVAVDTLIDRVWPAGAPAHPQDQLAVLVSRLRAVLGADRLSRGDAGYRLDADWYDLDALHELADEVERRFAAGQYGQARLAVGAALALVRGPVLPESDGEWVEADRAAASRWVGRVRRLGARAALAAGDPAGADELAAAALDADPYDEEALRLVMAARAAAGRPASALAAYADARRRLRDELGTSPAQDTIAAHAALLRDEPVPGMLAAVPPMPAVPVISSLPGRDAELAVLEKALTAAVPAVVAVRGEAGIGKTRLLDAFAERAAATGAVVLRGRCDELARALPLQVIADALDAHLRLIGAEQAAVILGPDAEVLAALLGRSEPGPAGSAAYAPADAATGQARLFAALLAVLDRIGAGGTVVFLLDDAQEAGDAVAYWLRYVLNRPAGPRLLVVAASRPGEGTDVFASAGVFGVGGAFGEIARPGSAWRGHFPEQPAGVVIELGPLPLAAVTELVGPDRAAALHARSGGHPLFLAELAAADPGDTLPESLREAVAAQIARAGDAAGTLRAAATIGPDIDLDLLAAVLDTSPLVVLGHLEEGVRRRLLDERDGRLAFRHTLVREALAAGMPQSRHAALHRQAARTLAARPGADPLRVAHHAREGGDTPLAVDSVLRAATLAGHRFDHQRQEELISTAIALADSVEARLARARVRIALGRYVEAGADATAAIDAGAGAAGLALAGWAAYYGRDAAAARRYADDGARLADSDAVRAACLTLAGRVRHSAGELAPAEQRLTQALGLATGREIVVPSVFLGVVRTHQGRPDEALTLLSPGTHAAADHPQPFTHLHALMVTAQTLGTLGRPAEALATLDRMNAAVDEAHALRFRGAAYNFRAWLLRNLGALSEADDLNAQSREIEPDATRGEVAEHTLLDLADGRLRADDLDSAATLLAETSQLVSASSAFAWRRDLRQRLLGARLDAARGEFASALDGAEELLARALVAQSPRYAVVARLLAARCRAGVGERVDASSLADDVAALDTLAGVEAWWLTAELAHALDVTAWWRLAEQRVDRLAAAAGPHGEPLLRHARRHFDRLR